MDSGKRQHLQDIYATDRTSEDEFTPQVSVEVLEERKRQIRRHQFTNFILGLLVLVLSVSLVYVVVREYIEIQSMGSTPTSIAQGYIPRYSLGSESQWVLDFPDNYGNPEWNGTGERPFNSQWVLKAAFNLILAEQAAGMGENEVAAKHYENALEILPDLKGVKAPLSALYFHMENFEKALALLEDASEADLTPEVLNNLGAACIHAEAYDRAESYLKQAIEMKPAYAEPQKNLAVLYKEQEREDEAVVAYEKYIDLRPMDIDTQHSLALYLTKLGRWEQAANLLEGLTREITDVPVLYFLLAQVEMHNNRPERAMAALQRGVLLTDSSSALAHMDSDEFDKLRESDEFQLMIRALERPKD
ncbi:MAG: tetratricopeptide repeat protein [Verrucomicrobiota bacterium]